MTHAELLSLAKEARKNAYAPYSEYRVGAALLCCDGTVFLGCNIENAAFSPTCCAERVAVFSAVNEGKREFSAIAIVGGKGGTLQRCTPCGVCRQVLSEFCSEDFLVITEENGEACSHPLSSLLPFSFQLS